jgi:hypothetical protein
MGNFAMTEKPKQNRPLGKYLTIYTQAPRTNGDGPLERRVRLLHFRYPGAAPMSIVISRPEARLLAKRINQFFDATRKK